MRPIDQSRSCGIPRVATVTCSFHFFKSNSRVHETKDAGYSKGRALVFLALSVLLIGLILAASWASDSRMTELRWVPRWLAMLADREPNSRTAIPFIPLAFLLAHGFAMLFRPARSSARRGLRWGLLGSVIVCGFSLSLSEFGQIFIPGRTADLMDLLWGSFGIVVGIGIAWGTSHLKAKL